jgi:hypothetical protein
MLSELSVNRKYPCEVIRELISNSYDAEASVIQIYPLLQYSGFIFFDNGTGLSDGELINDVIPLDAFFSIGLSTKTPGESIGYKCQGSKLCFASNKFALITRCGREDEKYWRSVVIDNPTETLDQEQDNIEVVEDKNPWLTIQKLLIQPDSRTKPIIEKLNEYFFSNDFKSGTLIFVKDLKVEAFSEFYNTDVKYSYLKSYIKYYTRHGDIRILNSDKTGFTLREEKMFKQSSPTSKKTCKLFVWNCNQKQGKLDEIPAGYPYIEKQSFDRESESNSPSSPAEIKKLSLGRFSSRKAKTFNYEGNTYCVALAIDGNRRALDYYEDLDRQGGKKSGIGFGQQRGTFICSEGIKICPYNDIFNHPLLSEYSVLSNPKAQSHYFFAINGSFRLVTNRNDLSEDSIKILKSEGFIEKIKDFLDILYAKDKIFEELVLRIAGEVSQMKIETQIKQFEKAKSTIGKRGYFYIKNIEVLKNKKLLIPKPGEENGVAALYALLSYFVPSDSEYARLWLRPLNFSGQGLDSIAEDCNKELKGLEYKYAFSTYEVFNHPFLITDQIICWNTDASVQEGETVSDGEYQGIIKKTEDLRDVGFLITDILSSEGDYNGDIKVISLEKLIDKTFQTRWLKSELTRKNRRVRN